MKKYSKLLFLFLLVSIFLNTSKYSLANVTLEVEYPQIPGASQITSTTPLTEYLRYLFLFGISISFLAAFVSLLIGGGFYIISAGRPGKIASAKSQIFAGFSGLILILLAYLIIVTINPDLSIFKTQELFTVPGVYLKRGTNRINLLWCQSKNLDQFSQIEYECDPGSLPPIIVYFHSDASCSKSTSITEMDCGQIISIPSPRPKSISWTQKSSGVYFYEQNNCPVSQTPFSTERVFYSSIPNLETLRNRLSSAKIIHDGFNKVYFITVLYEFLNYYGRCYYVSPSGNCDNLDNTKDTDFKKLASSASIYRYSLTPTGSGVTFYRKANFNEEGGSLKITNAQIKDYIARKNTAAFVGDLNSLTFQNVPVEEQDCIKWDLEGKCAERTLPALAEENISSIEIDGNYFVMLVHFNPDRDHPSGKWSYCQGFPTIDNVNKDGPKQIKWEHIRQREKYPNYLLIFPIEKE